MDLLALDRPGPAPRGQASPLSKYELERQQRIEANRKRMVRGRPGRGDWRRGRPGARRRAGGAGRGAGGGATAGAPRRAARARARGPETALARSAPPGAARRPACRPGRRDRARRRDHAPRPPA
jgi:hypothetical protein